nr:hypothetical protein HmN_000452600 [Hymenolepis microstoma]
MNKNIPIFLAVSTTHDKAGYFEMSSTQNDHIETGDNLEHVGLSRPRKPKNHKPTTIIPVDGEKIEHKPVSTEDLYMKPKEFPTLEDTLSKENVNEVKPMKNKPVGGIALTGMALGQVKLRSLKSDDSRTLNEEKDGSLEPVINGKDNPLSQIKLKPISPTTTEDTVNSIPLENSLDESHSSENESGDFIRPGLLKNNPFIQLEMKRREEKRRLLQNEPSRQNLKVELPYYERQNSNQENSLLKPKAPSPVTLKKRSVETPPFNSSELTSFTEPPPQRKISKVETSIGETPPAENSKLTTQLRKSDSSSSSTDSSDSTDSSQNEDENIAKITTIQETHFRDSAQKCITTTRQISSENETGTHIQLRKNKILDHEKRKSAHSSNARKSDSSKISSVPSYHDSSRKSNQMVSWLESSNESSKLVPRSESKKEIEGANRKSHSPTIPTTPSSSTSTTSSKAQSEASSGKRLYQKSGIASSPRKVSSSSSASGISLRDKCESEKESDHANSSSAKPKVEKQKLALKTADAGKSEVTFENRGPMEETIIAAVVEAKRKPTLFREQNEKSRIIGQDDYASSEFILVKNPEHSYEKQMSLGETSEDQSKVHYSRRNPVKWVRKYFKYGGSSSKNSENPILDQENGGKVHRRKTSLQRSMPNLAEIPGKPVKRPRRRWATFFLKKPYSPTNTFDEDEGGGDSPQPVDCPKYRRSKSFPEYAQKGSEST